MNKIKFFASHYWNKEEMNLNDSVTPEQWVKVEEIANILTNKYSDHDGCPFHPNQILRIPIGLFNGFLDIQVVIPETCGCYNTLVMLAGIRDTESAFFNKNG